MTADVLVIGAGVIGLTSAIRLLETGASVTILSPVEPAGTTSSLATAMVGPTFGLAGDRGSAWEQETLRRVDAEPTARGVHRCLGRFVARPEGLVPPGVEALPRYRPCTEQELPAGYRSGFWAEVPLIDMPRYLPFLAERFVELGGTLRGGAVDSLNEAAEQAPRIVNCSGLGARDLVPDPQVTPLRGPKIVVANPGIETFLIEGPPGPEGTSFHPHGDRVVLGGSRTASWDTTPDPREERAIIARCAAIEPRLAHAEVLEHRVGLRPDRAEVRVELEQLGTTRVVHNYGHGGLGVTLSWGCAAEAARLLDG